jgi:hypothetical protein
LPPAAWISPRPPQASRLGLLEQPGTLRGRSEHDRPAAQDPGCHRGLQRAGIGGERHPRRDVRRHQPVLGDRDEHEVEEEPLLFRRLVAREQQMEVLGEREPTHEVAGQVAPAHLYTVRVGLRDRRA